MKIASLIMTIGGALALGACGSGSEQEDTAAVDGPDSAAVAPAQTSEVPEVTADPAPEEEAAPAPAEEAAAPVATEAVTPVASSGPPQSFMICSSCHAIEPGKNGIGPTLANIYGAKAAAVPGFSYSEPLKKANITWTDAALDKWLQAPMKMVPGTRMVFGGIPDAAKRKELIDYMKTL